jgi:hypothetical protein
MYESNTLERSVKNLGAVTVATLVAGCASVTSLTQTPEHAPPSIATTHWQAMSTTAMSITGDITLTNDRLTFSNQDFLTIEPVDRNAEDGQTLFRVTTKTNPELLNGNLICGNQPIDYLLVQISGEVTGQSDMQLKAYYYPEQLRLADLPLKDKDSLTHLMCALYTYVSAPTK